MRNGVHLRCEAKVLKIQKLQISAIEKVMKVDERR